MGEEVQIEMEIKFSEWFEKLFENIRFDDNGEMKVVLGTFSMLPILKEREIEININELISIFSEAIGSEEDDNIKDVVDYILKE